MLIASTILSALLCLQDAPGAVRGLEPPARPATVPAIPLDEMRRRNELDIRKAAAEIQEIPARSIDQLIALRLDDRGLVEAVPVIGETDGVKRLDLPAPIGGLVNINASPGSADGARPSFVDFQHVDFAPPMAVMHALQVFARGDYLQISWDETGVASSSRLQLIQAPQMNDDPQQHLRLYYDRFDSITDAHVDHQQYSAASFPQMLRAHRDEMLHLVLSPLRRRELHAALLSTPVPLAWQVLGDRADAPAGAEAAVLALVEKLNSDRFADRESAARQLRHMGAPAVVVLRKIDRSKFSEEQRQAIDTIVAQYAPMPERETAGLERDPLFLVGCLYADAPDLWSIAGKLIEEATGRRVSIGGTPEERRREADRLLDELILAPAERRAATRPTSRPS
mgnify:CR=1 FL=1